MPIMDGIAAAKLIRQGLIDLGIQKEDQPAIIGITGHVQERYKQEGLLAGMDEILSKPLYTDVFLNILNKYNII